MRVIGSLLETLVLVFVLTVAAVAIGIAFLVTLLIRAIAGVANDPNAGPYRQVR